MFSLLTGGDPITLYRVQLPCPASGGQSPAFESRECKPGVGKRFYLSVLADRELESVWRTMWAFSQGAEGQPACECRVIGVPGDKECKLKHCIKDPEIPLAGISLGNSLAVEETIAPSRSRGWFVTVGSPDNFPTGCFAPKRDRAEIVSLEVGKEGRKERENFTEDTIFLSTQRTGSMKGMKTCSVVFYWWIPALTSEMNFLFCSFFEYLGIWDFCLIFCLSLLIQLSWIKIHCYSSCGGGGDWTWSSLLGPFIQRSPWDKEEWV